MFLIMGNARFIPSTVKQTILVLFYKGQAYYKVPQSPIQLIKAPTLRRFTRFRVIPILKATSREFHLLGFRVYLDPKEPTFLRTLCIRTCMHTYIHIYIHTYVRTYVRTYIHTYIYTHMHADMQGTEPLPPRG